MRSLDKDELLAQLAEKERRIKGHLDAMKDQGDFVTRSLKGRAQDVGGQLRQASGQMQIVVPALVGGGLALWLAGKAVGALLRRRRRARRRLGQRELALLLDVISYHMQHPGALHPQPSPPPEPQSPTKKRISTAAELFLLLLAAMAGAALTQVPWRELLQQVQGGEPAPDGKAPPEVAPVQD